MFFDEFYTAWKQYNLISVCHVLLIFAGKLRRRLLDNIKVARMHVMKAWSGVEV